MRTILFASIAVLSMTGCSAAPAPDADEGAVPLLPSRLGTETLPQPTFGYFLTPTQNLVVDIRGGNEFGLLQTYTANGGANQLFAIGPKHSIVGAQGACIAIPGARDVDGTQLATNTCNGQSNQAWYFSNTLIAALGKCVDLPGGVETSGTPVQIYSCNNGSNQRWWFWSDTSFVTNPDAFEIRTIGGMCLDVAGSTVVIHGCGLLASQYWLRGPQGSLVNGANGRCLTAASSNDGTLLTATTCNGGENQRLGLAGELRSGLDHTKCMDVRGASTSPGAEVQLYTCNGGANQTFGMWN